MNLKGRTLTNKVRPFIFCFFLFILISPVQANDSAHYIEKATTLNLAQDPFWLNLLHYHGHHTQLRSQEFFLSDRGKYDPQAELEATITAYFTNKHNIKRPETDPDVQCLFPARYMWLHEKLSLPNYQTDLTTQCPLMSEWTRINDIEAVSVMFVSSYLGNPASSFGHLMMNFKLKGNEDLEGLLDTSVSFGAVVPPNENIILYVLKGLFGGYESSFTNKFFYAHDQVYSNREFRDMWEYKLNLSEDQKKMLIYHAWELLGYRYRYFFLTANCAHRVAVLLDIFIEEEVYDTNFPIYVPEFLFHRLQEIDDDRREQGKEGLIESITFIPSAQRKLYYETLNLSDEEREAYRHITNNREIPLGHQLQQVKLESRINVLNALLAYQYYKLMATDDGGNNKDQELVEYKNKILLERLKLPSRVEEPLDIPEIPSPREVSPPTTVHTGFVVEESGESFATAGLTVFRKESVGLNSLEFNEIVALSLNIGISDEDVFFDRFDVLKIRDFKTLYLPEANESPFSWQMRIGVDRYDHEGKSAYDYMADGGVGYVKQLNEYGIVYGFVNASVHSLDQQYLTGPSIGTILGNDHVKLQLDYGLEFGLEYEEMVDVVDAKLQYQINREHALQFTYEKNERTRWGIHYIYYW